jgi:PDZ domain-containing protein
MNELTNKFWPFIRLLIFPYLFFMFVLLYPIEYYVHAPGGIVEVESLITIEYNEDKVIEGSISSTYIMSINRPTFFQFMISEFSDYTYSNVITGSYSNYTNEEINQISYLDKATSVDASIIVAYQQAGMINSEIIIDYYPIVLVFGKAPYLSHYNDINFGDEFIKMIGDGGVEVVDFLQIGNNIGEATAYEFTFKNKNGEYTRILELDEEENKFGITFKRYLLVNKENTFPNYQERHSNIGGPSGGLMQTLAIYNMLVEQDVTKGLKIAGTGTINYDGTVGYIGGTEQKITTAYLNKVDLFFIPFHDPNYYYDNYMEALRACEKYGIDPTGWLIPVSSFADVLDYLNGVE